MSEVFISWSKDRGQQLAKAIRELTAKTLEQTLGQPSDPNRPGEYVTYLSEDLPKGGNWFNTLAQSLESASAGIVCVTPESRSSPWLLFEAGALIRCDYEVALFPVLLDLAPQNLEGPMSLIQSTVIERDPDAIRREVHGMLVRVVEHVNQIRGNPVIEWPADHTAAPGPWDEFVDAVLAIDYAGVPTLVAGFEKAFERKTFREPFRDCADQRWIERLAGARHALAELDRNRSILAAAAPPGAQRAYANLASAVDGYAMAITGLLIEEQQFGRDTDGRLIDEGGALDACERRRKSIEAAYLRLADPSPPVYDDARIYEELTSLEERKRLLIHPLERRLAAKHSVRDETPLVDPQMQSGADADGRRQRGSGGGLWRLDRARSSGWLYDRLVYYISGRFTDDITLNDLVTGLEFEITRLETLDEPDTLVGIYYVLESLDVRTARVSVKIDLGDSLDRIDTMIQRWNTRSVDTGAEPAERWDRNRKVRRVVERLRTRGAGHV